MKALDLIDEAYDAISLENGLHMWESADTEARKDVLESAETVALIRSNIGRAAAAARLLKDPKQKAKEWVLGCWKTWQVHPHLYPSQAAFARSMLEKEIGLTSQPTIEAWCREWKKATLTQPAQ
ncbi:hypothetical protein L1889_03715 [Paenalcaligenes niemegkensis]|uniref:hypothetical protein n=1 Tax=Paenalcaligenes niemegkensis TaxID=2895469 RepID=UPI001EE90982|nr:hypothetical protein [Paenalcaligenes niemegkensis]MCQ9615917.1 hypothetical protein [Paenalcaligenes niemegkensis]